MGQKKQALTPEVVKPGTLEESGREKARRILHIGEDLDTLTADDLLQHIFNLALEVQNEDPKNAITFRVAIDAMQTIYKEIQGRPPRVGNQEDKSGAFMEEWGIVK